MIHVGKAFRIVNCIVTEVPCSTIVDLLLVGNQVIDFLNISLEVTVVLECFILSDDSLRILVKPVGAGSEGSSASQKKQRATQKGFNVIIVFHNVHFSVFTVQR